MAIDWTSLLGAGLNLYGASQGADQATAAANTAAQMSQFRPVGVTTRFGRSGFNYDPTTGQLTGAGYQAAPDIAAMREGLLGLAGGGLSQARQAQAFQPTVTQAGQGLFNLGQQYIAQTPQQAAQNWMSQQQQLLAPGREQELAQLTNKEFQRGTLGLATGATQAGYTAPMPMQTMSPSASFAPAMPNLTAEFNPQTVATGANFSSTPTIPSTGTMPSLAAEFNPRVVAENASFYATPNTQEKTSSAAPLSFNLSQLADLAASNAAAPAAMNTTMMAPQPQAFMPQASMAPQPQASAPQGLMASNPRFAAMYNARALQDAQMAAQAQQAGMEQIRFGQGLLTGGLDVTRGGYGLQTAALNPFTNYFQGATNIEQQAMAPLEAGRSFGSASAAAGAEAARQYAQGQAAQRAALQGAYAGLADPIARLIGGLAG